MCIFSTEISKYLGNDTRWAHNYYASLIGKVERWYMGHGRFLMVIWIM